MSCLVSYFLVGLFRRQLSLYVDFYSALGGVLGVASEEAGCLQYMKVWWR
jgi:hypothetical protein